MSVVRYIYCVGMVLIASYCADVEAWTVFTMAVSCAVVMISDSIIEAISEPRKQESGE